jgi:hypothetical protein
MDRALAGALPARAGGRRLAELTAAATRLLSQTPLTRAELGRALAPRWPDHDPAALAHAASHLLTLVQVPPRGLWRQSGPAAFFLASAWLAGHSTGPADLAHPAGHLHRDDPLTPPDPRAIPAAPLTPITPPAPPDPTAAAEELVLRYLAAYGPASVADIQMWSGLTRLREVTERLGARLRPLAGPDGAALLDLADAPPGADPDAPAPPRFLPEYDNLLLSFAERSRVIPHRRPVPLPPGNGATRGTLLVDGFWQAEWKISKDGGVLEIRPFVPLSAADRASVTAEGERLLDFAGSAGTARDVRFVQDGNS